ncbi:alpha/beta hydrolase [Actinoplanes missouriensis]|uniref:alpha/beta fold hydrolase n=1 Tax=Actinoplanes missouriensis TaxID=1866 RepID=UPI0033F12992
MGPSPVRREARRRRDRLLQLYGLSRVDVLGWSMGGIVAQGVALRSPDLVHRLIVASSSSGGVPDPARGERLGSTGSRTGRKSHDPRGVLDREQVPARRAGCPGAPRGQVTRSAEPRSATSAHFRAIRLNNQLS